MMGTQPTPTMHMSVAGQGVPVQLPAWHVSFDVHGSLSLQDPLFLGVLEQLPVSASHAAAWH
jgi:hypothetical protein